MSGADNLIKAGKGKISVVTAEQAECVDYVVCMPTGPSRFTDNETGSCAHCGREIMFRPYMPKAPPKICISCAHDLVTGGEA